MTATDQPRIVIDARIIDRPGMEHTGLGRYTVEIVRGLRSARPHWELVVLSNRAELFAPLLRPRPTRWPTASSVGRITWLQAVSRLALARIRADAWFGTAFVVPRWWNGPSVVTVHDLLFLTMPRRYRGRLNAAHAAWATQSSIARAQTVISVSGATRDALVGLLHVRDDRVQVIHNGVSEIFHRPRGASSSAPANPPYVLFVGTFEARKGLDTLAGALQRLRDDGSPLSAVLAGHPGWGSVEVMRRLRLLGADVRIGPDDDELAELYAGALALAHLSRQEGFGLPVAEGMACGTAVVSTDLPSVREFASDVPMYVDVADAAGVARHLQTLRDHPEELRQRREAGRAAARSLRWELVAERHAEVLERILAG